MSTILILDDDRVNRELLGQLVRYRGHDAIEAADGTEGLLKVRAHRPDLVIADILMPTMDGYEFVRQLRTDPAIAGTAVMFYTANYLEREARSLIGDCGVTHLLTKPAEPEAILRMLDDALNDARTSAAPPADLVSFDREHLRVVTDKLVEKVRALSANEARMAELVSLGQRIAEERDGAALLNLACGAARRLAGAKHALLCVPGEDAGVVRTFLTKGFEDTAGAGVTLPLLSGGALAPLLAGHQAVRGRNPGGHAEALGFPANQLSVDGYLGVSIASAGSTYGWILLLNKLGGMEFTEADEQAVRTVGSQAGIAYEGVLLHERCRNGAVALQREMVERQRAEAAIADQRLRVLKATVRTVQDIVNNCLNNFHLFRLEAEGILPDALLAQFDRMIFESAGQLRKLGDLDATPERETDFGTVIDYKGC